MVVMEVSTVTILVKNFNYYQSMKAFKFSRELAR